MNWEQAVRDFSRYLMLERSLSENTLAAYVSDLQKLAEWSVEQKLNPTAIRRNDLQSFLKHISESGLSVRSQARLVTSVKSFYRFLVYDHSLDEDPSELIDSPRIGRKLPQVLTNGEIEKMLTEIDRSTPEGERNRAILETLYGCGLRVSELIGLQLTDIHRKEAVLRVIGKGDKERLVPINDYALQAMSLYINSVRVHTPAQRGEENIVFLSKRGKRMGRSTVFTMIRELAAKAGIKKNIGPHTFRHSFATGLVQNGADLRIVQELLGHESITTTEIYTHLDERQLRATIEKYHPRA